jgi:hypothetical protein
MIMTNLPRGDTWDSDLDGDIPSRSKTRWNGRTVFLDGECILRTGGQMKMIGSSEAEFHHDGALHVMKLTWGRAHGLSFPYQLWIDGAKVLVSNVPIANKVLIVVPGLVLIVVPGLVLTSPLWVAYLLSFL